GSRLYKTGDLARFLADGNIDYLGRLDHQVKLRGLRIELGEIEAALRALPQVRDAVVLAREDQPGDQRLVGYVVRNDIDIDRAALQLTLQASLPAYMVPSVWVTLDALPLNPNGKVDRKALPVPDASLSQAGYVAPRSETEQKLAAIWAEVLKVERVGIHDNFFELGGHSLLAVRLLSAMEQAGVKADVRGMYAAATLAELAAAIDVSPAGAAAFAAPPNRIPAACQRITPDMLPLIDLTQDEIDRIVATVPGGAANVQDIYPLAPLQEGMYFYHLMHRESDPYVIPSLFAVDTPAQFEALLDALRSVIARHDVLRTAILSDQLRVPAQVVYRQLELNVEMIELGTASDPQSQLEARFNRPMDLSRAPMLEVCVAREPHTGKVYVLFRSHHLIDDATSSMLLHREIQAHLGGQAAALAEPVPYREFLAHALDQAGRSDIEDFFRKTLGDVTEPTAPFRLLNVHGDGSATVEDSKALDAALARDIRQVARRRRISPATLFHAACALVIGACSARDDVVFGTVLSGRLQGTAGASNMLGMFINTLPLRLKLEGISVDSLVTQTELALRELLSYEQAPLSLAQRCSGLASHVPLFSAILNYRNAARSADGQGTDTSADDIALLAYRLRTNYPMTISIDDRGDDFLIDAHVHHSIVPLRVIAYLEQALAGLVQALRSQPDMNAGDISVLPPQEREQLLA
ncbi:condensation domain-containing protein, partial [Janthinobacterium sp. SUN137]|uniref:condensation domain-containing protein n=1 Tax=Janthinobacterium sp. SUN137 TaxID=3014789 RepID=UPI0027142763